MPYHVTVKRAAELTGMSALTIQSGIKKGYLDFGIAIPRDKRTTIYIIPGKLAEYLGISVDEVIGNDGKEK